MKNKLLLFAHEGWYYVAWGQSLGEQHKHIKRFIRWAPWWRVFQIPVYLATNLARYGSVFHGKLEPETDTVRNGDCVTCGPF